MYNSIFPTVISFNFHVIVHTALHDRAGTTASTIYTGLYEVNGSSRKYTGGQSRDQSVFENGAMWVRLSLLSISTGRVGS